MTPAALTATLDDLRELVSEELGLHFPPSRNADLQRALKAAAREQGIATLDEFAPRLRSTPSRTRAQLLAPHLTIGETYFYRHGSLFDAVEQEILPELLRAKAATGRRLRLWSAACCTGEEAYSLAIAVHRAIPDLSGWDVSIVGTDLNPRFLEKAEEGVFSTWSFRDTPPGFRERYFSRVAEDKWRILPKIRELVTFAPMNLVEDFSPAHPPRTTDIVFCRNALIYFTPEQAARLIQRFADHLPEGGWLMTAPSETALVTIPTLAPVRFPGAMAFRKSSSPAVPASIRSRPDPLAFDFIAEQPADIAPSAGTVSPRTAAPAQPPPADDAAPSPVAARAAQLALAARIAANERRFAEALVHGDELVALNKCDAGAHYLRAGILEEAGERERAIEALKRVLYLEPDFILAHFALGNLHRREGELARADRHFAHALELARRQPCDQLVPSSDGLTAGQLAQILTAMIDGQTRA